MAKQTIDRAALMDSVQNDRELLGDLIELFEEYYPATLAKINVAVTERDFSSLREASHQLKGSVSNFHAVDARNTAFDLEKKGRDCDFDGVEQLSDRLDAELTRLLNELYKILEESN